MNEIDERLTEIRGRDWVVYTGEQWERYASVDLRYLLDLVADLRERLEGARLAENILREELAQIVTLLVPEAGLVEQVAQMMWRYQCEDCPSFRGKCPGFEDDKTNGLCTVLTIKLRFLANRIRDWREEQGQE